MGEGARDLLGADVGGLDPLEVAGQPDRGLAVAGAAVPGGHAPRALRGDVLEQGLGIERAGSGVAVGTFAEEGGEIQGDLVFRGRQTKCRCRSSDGSGAALARQQPDARAAAGLLRAAQLTRRWPAPTAAVPAAPPCVRRGRRRPRGPSARAAHAHPPAVITQCADQRRQARTLVLARVVQDVQAMALEAAEGRRGADLGSTAARDAGAHRHPCCRTYIPACGMLSRQHGLASRCCALSQTAPPMLERLLLHREHNKRCPR